MKRNWIIRCVILFVMCLLFVVAGHLNFLKSHFALGMLCTTASIFLMIMAATSFVCLKIEESKESK